MVKKTMATVEDSVVPRASARHRVHTLRSVNHRIAVLTARLEDAKELVGNIERKFDLHGCWKKGTIWMTKQEKWGNRMNLRVSELERLDTVMDSLKRQIRTAEKQLLEMCQEVTSDDLRSRLERLCEQTLAIATVLALRERM